MAERRGEPRPRSRRRAAVQNNLQGKTGGAALAARVAGWLAQGRIIKRPARRRGCTKKKLPS